MKLRYIIEQGEKTGVYIGQCVDFPGITMYAKTKSELDDKMQEAIDAYFCAFPEEKQKIHET